MTKTASTGASKRPATQPAAKAPAAGRQAVAVKPKAAAKAATPKTAAGKSAAPAPKKAVVAKSASVKKPASKSAPAKKPAPNAAPAKVAAKPAAAPGKAPTPAKAAAPVAPAAAPLASRAPVAPASVPVSAPKASRSSKLSMTVPSMPPAVASTAAKASYTQSMSTPVLAPPPNVTIKKDPKLANNWKTKTADQLTDAEVLAMPDGEYMNDKQMAFFRLKLVQLKQDILDNAGETTEHLREDTVVVPDPADRATIEEEHALELRTRDRERKLLKKIEQSIARIDAGDYGYCDETGEPIGVGRLLARPTATLSLEAQQRRELKQKMFGD